MTSKELVESLRKEIHRQLAPFMTADYWLMEIPQYDNVGDHLILQGELDFLRQFPFRCKGMRGVDTGRPARIREDDLILFQGGGNFGDLWAKHHDFKMKVMKEHPKNRFLFFPQTVYFKDEANMKNCAKFMSRFDAVVCARDNMSYDILKANFANRILLVPDMAFFMDLSRWHVKPRRDPICPLVLMRQDQEQKRDDRLLEIIKSSNADVSDWAPMMRRGLCEKVFWRLHRAFPLMYDLYKFYAYHPYAIWAGMRQILEHSTIYADRLHACILSILVNKPDIFFFDNSYGKNRTMYETYLKDCDAVKMEV